jgi:hypothetical protein
MSLVSRYSHFSLATVFPVTDIIQIMLRIWFSVNAIAIEIILPLLVPLFYAAFGKMVGGW